MSQLAIKVSLKSLGLSHQPRVIILTPSQLSMRRVKRLIRSPQLKLLSISQLIKLIRPLLRLIEIIINRLDLRVIILTLSLLHRHSIPQPINFILVPSLLLPKLAQLILQIVSIFPQGIGLVALDTDLALQGYALLLSAADLVAYGANLGLVLIVGAVLLIQQEAEVLDFFAECVGCDHILVVPVVVVVVLHEFLVLEVSILLLDSVELVAKGNIVFVTLLDLEDFSLELRDKEVLLVTGEMH